MNCNDNSMTTDLALDDEIVISGIAGRLPGSDNVKHFQENLFNKMDLGSDDCRRWQHDHPDIPKRTGKVNNIHKFDAEYFDVPFNEAHLLDPMNRCLLEYTYEAIIDAGINPKDLRGTKTGVIVGTSFCESENIMVYEKTQFAGSLGCKRNMQANRISYWLGTTGPSFTIDTACSSSIFAIEQAYRYIRYGKCDSMIVAATNLCLNPQISLQFMRLGVLSPNGFCRPFDVSANGYMSSEAIAVVYLQKARNAKRIYATLVYSKTNCDGFKEQGITFPSTEMQSLLFQQFYDECNVSPFSVAYIEAHGTGTKVGDPEEINAIEKVFCKNRHSPLLIGSSKSNTGHSEPASGLLQIFKVVIAMETSMIPPNIHFTKERDDCEAFKKGTIRVVTTTTAWEPTFVGINSFGFGGANAHLLLAPNMKKKINGGAPEDDLPRLIVLSGRTEQAVESFLREVENQSVDVEYIRLLHDLFADDMQHHPYRGYTIVEPATLNNIISKVEHYSGRRKPICYVFSGIGSQWRGMGEALLRFPVFLKTVQKCDTVLRSYGVHIINILTSKQKTTFDSILNSVLGINMMQLGLIDLLMSVNIMPNYVIGHSIGELCCGYITGDLTIEQVILSAYYIGLALEASEIVHYIMADIGLGYTDTKDICPPDIKIICNYSSNSCCISGPTESMKAFTKKLEINEIFYKEVNCCNIPLHSCYLAPARNKILDYLYRVIPQKMSQSHIWRRLSCDTDLSCAEYFTNNLVNPMFFKDVTRLIPENVAFIEIAPDGILQRVLMELFDTTTIALAQRNCKDNVKVFLQGLGKMYNCGLQPQLANLYPTVEFPVSRGTPMISPSIKWNHCENWHVPLCTLTKQIASGETIIDINKENEDYTYMSGHVIDGRNLLPATGYIQLIWKMVGMLEGKLYNNMPIVFEDVKFIRATLLPDQRAVQLTLMVQKGTGKFEIIEGDNVIVTGRVHVPLELDKDNVSIDYLPKDDDEEEVIQTRDIYKELKLRGYQYAGLFRCLKSLSVSASRGHIAWMNDWVAFMDNMLQIKILEKDTRSLYVPTGIEKLVIDPKLHMQYLKNATSEDIQIPVRVYKESNIIISGGVRIHGLMASPIFRRKPMESPVLEEYKFVAHRDKAKVSFEDGIILSTHLVLEYHQTSKVDIIEFIEDGDEIIIQELVSPIFVQVLTNLPLIQPNITLVKRTTFFDNITLPPKITVSQSKKLSIKNNAVLVAGCNLLTRSKNEILKEILLILKADGFLLTRGQSLTKEEIANAERYNLKVVLEKQTENEYITLMKKRGRPISKTEVICVNNYEFSWLEQLRSVLSAENELARSTRIIIVGERNAECGLLGLVNCLRKEPGGELIRGVFIQDENAPKFSFQDPFYAEQLQIDLVINVLRPGKIWGSYRHLPLAPLKPKLVHHAFVNQMVLGDLNSLRWIEGTITSNCQHEDLVNIIYAPLNFRDVMLATGKIMEGILSRGRLEDCMIGFEYAGIDNTGRRVMGIYETKCMSNKILTDKYLSWQIPDEWSLEDAATVPCVYGTCYYALYLHAKLKKGERILVHSGTGGVGQAAIHIALHDGCEVFTTVSTLEKRRFIRENFPSIPEDHIGYSRDTSFEQMIYQQTNGRGVDIVLNSLAEDKLQASVRCLAKGGRFLEIGKFDMMTNNTLDISVFSKGITFYGIMLDKLFTAEDERKQTLYTALATGIESGAVKPITRKIFQKDELEAAFRYMAAGKHIGKIIIKIQEEENFKDVPILALPRYYCLANRSYIILGGLGGFGMELADWLVIRGAKNLVMISRTGIKNGYQRMKIKQWKSYGVKVLIISNVDASNVKDCERMLKAAEELAPTDAIFNLAVLLNDKICPNHTIETFQEPFKAKAWATEYLDQLSRKICPQLRHFVVFSSVSCGKGNAEQTNYGMANSIMERICERRSQEGLHGLAIQWGAIGDVGIVADMQEDDKEMIIGGTLQQKIRSCIEKLEEFLLQEQPVVTSMIVAEKHIDGGSINIIDTIANIMGLKDLNTVSHQARFSELGMDSMMAVEIKQSLEREFGVFLTAQDIRNLNLAKLIEMFNQEAKTEKLRSDDTSDANNLIGVKLLVRMIDKVCATPDVCMNLPTKGDITRNEIFLLPGIEGYGDIFSSLGPKIEAPATCLQYGTYNTGKNFSTIAEIADNVLKHMMNRIKSKRDFLIIAYSYGTLIAIELARRLEGMLLRGRLILIDGAPEQLKILADQFITNTTINEIQNNTLLNIMDFLNPAVSGKLLLELNKCVSWDNKLNIFINHLSTTNKGLSSDFTRALCVTIYNHIRAIHAYDVVQQPKIISPIILLKPTLQSLRLPDEDYGLHKITTGNVEVHYVEANHVTILDSDKVVAAINKQYTKVPVENSQLYTERKK